MESFWTACNARGPLILDIEEVETVKTTRHAFDRPSLIIGRGPRSDLRIDHSDVSKRHAYLQMIGGHLFFVDLDSRTGIHAEGGKLASGWVVPGHPIRIGPFRVWFRSGGAEEDGNTVVGSNPLSSKDVRVISRPSMTLLVEDGDEASSIPIVRTLILIGRSPRCKIQLAWSEASRFHAALVRTPWGVWVVDLRSMEGVSVNGSHLNHARLEDGDELRMGPFMARVDDPGTPARRTLPSASEAGLSVARPAAPGSPLEVFDPRALLDQIASIERPSNDQVGQAILMLTQLFGSMHREMVDLVREELEQIRRLSAELQTLRAETPGKIRTRLVPPVATQARASSGPTISDDHAPVEPTRPRDPGEVHLIVSERLATFEREREGRWNKISRILLKTGP
jgi:pSer/pThr/pTyr-binding forkhead associated (FHA) protein